MLNKILSTFVVMIAASFSFNHTVLAADKGYYSSNAMGWHWGDVNKHEVDNDDEDQSDPVVQMNAVRATISRAKDQMVLNPTKENVKNYINIQNQVSQNATKVGQTWQEVLLENPEMNYSLVHPTNNLAKQVENDVESANENEALKEFAKRSGLFFFYRSTCPYCVRFAPIVKEFAESYGITVVPITTDGVSLPEFPKSFTDQGQAVKFNVKVEPALFAVNPYTHQAIPLAYGLTSEVDIKRKILSVINKLKKVSQ